MISLPGVDKKFMKIILIVAVLSLWLWFRRDSGSYELNKGFFEIIIFGGLYFMGEYIMWQGRYNSPFVVCNGMAGSIDGRPVVIGDYVIFRLGAIYWPEGVISFPGKLGTLILPVRNTTKIGRNYASRCVAKKVISTRVPMDCYDYIINKKSSYNIDEMYVGSYTEEFMLKNKDILPEIDSLKESLHQQINEINDLLQNRHDIVQEHVATAEELTSGRDRIRLFQRRREREDER